MNDLHPPPPHPILETVRLVRECKNGKRILATYLIFRSLLSDCNHTLTVPRGRREQRRLCNAFPVLCAIIQICSFYRVYSSGYYSSHRKERINVEKRALQRANYKERINKNALQRAHKLDRINETA